ncbi:response regulator [Emcibacter nanhaiensis]|uniref:Response regulator transcription factor n=1 Tax=Emcibacter nanhaiensis TaxID=1505037 RepID=A0A501P9V5_9PROT|nr:response regulator transcription factor [Emcibacter nanhaiensis]TPD56826.1 response regulator transcription factor [Emcibacter nanhaiensis]
MKKILIVEDISETRNWLTEISRKTFPDAEISEAPSMRQGIAQAGQGNINLALIDLGLPDGSGLEILRALKSVSPETLCVITTVMGDDAHIVAALSAGAQGYLLKEQPADMISQQLSQLAQGIPALSPSIARRIMEHFKLTGPAIMAEDKLTAREQDVLALIARGLRNSEVAINLGLADSTVASHIKAIYRKLGISSRAEASWHATQLGLLSKNKPS